MLSLYKKNPHLLMMGVIFLCSLTFFNFLNFKLYSMWDLTIPPFDPTLQADKVLSVWDYSFWSGRLYALLWNWPIFYVSALVQNLMRVEVFYTLWHWFLFLLSGVGMYYYIVETVNMGKTRNIRWGALMGGLVYMFNPFWVFRAGVTFYTIYILAFLPYILLLLQRAIDSQNVGYFQLLRQIIEIALISLLMIPGLANLPVAMATAIFIGLYLFGYATLNNRFKNMLIVLLALLPLVIMTHVWWLYPNLFHSAVKESLNREGQYISETFKSLNEVSDYEYTSYFNILRNNVYANPKVDADVPLGMPILDHLTGNLYHTALFVCVSFLVPLLILGAMIVKKTWKHTCFLPLMIALLVFIPILAGLRPPFGTLLNWSFHNIPLMVLRRPFSYMFLVSFAYAYMLSISVIIVINQLESWKSINRQRVGVALLFVIMFGVIGVYNFPKWMGINTSVYVNDRQGLKKRIAGNIVVPTYVHDVSEYLNNEVESGAVLVLPRGGMLRVYDWDSGYFGWDYYYLTLQRPVLSASTNRYDAFYVYEYIHKLIDDERLTDDTYARLLAKLNIGYILVAEDSLIYSGTEYFDVDNLVNFFEPGKYCFRE